MPVVGAAAVLRINLVVIFHKKHNVYTINCAENHFFTVQITAKYKAKTLGDCSNHLLFGEMAPPYLPGLTPRPRCTA